MEDDRIELTRRGFEVYNESGPGAYIEYLDRRELIHPDFLFHIQEDLPNGGDWRGVAAFHRMSEIWLEAWGEFKVLPREFIEVDEEWLLVAVEQRAVARGSGIEVSGDFFYVLRFKDGKVAEQRLYSDRAEAEAFVETSVR
jgi:ketosteroid isomerase-like protein